MCYKCLYGKENACLKVPHAWVHISSEEMSTAHRDGRYPRYL